METWSEVESLHQIDLCTSDDGRNSETSQDVLQRVKKSSFFLTVNFTILTFSSLPEVVYQEVGNVETYHAFSFQDNWVPRSPGQLLQRIL